MSASSNFIVYSFIVSSKGYFANVTNSLAVHETGSSVVSADEINDPVELTVIKYSLHPSSKRMTAKFHPPETYEFRLARQRR